jgi:hypothetical protein
VPANNAVKSIENPHFKTTTPECLLKTAIEIQNSTAKSQRRQGKAGFSIQLRMIKGFTKRVNFIFVVSSLRSWRHCGKMVLYCVF